MARHTLQRNPPCSDALLVPCASLAVTHCVCHFSTLPTYPGLCVQGSAPSLLLPWRLKPPRPQLRPQLRRRNSVSCTQRTTPMTMARPHLRPCMLWLARVLPFVMLHCVRRVSEGDRDPHGTRPHPLVAPRPCRSHYALANGSLGGQVHYEQAGNPDGKPVIFVHGGALSCARHCMWGQGVWPDR